MDIFELDFAKTFLLVNGNQDDEFITSLIKDCSDRVEGIINRTFPYFDGEVPLPIKQAILLLMAQSYEFRDTPQAKKIPMMADALLMPWRDASFLTSTKEMLNV